MSVDAQVFWDGGAGSSLWSGANNWRPDGVPASSSNVVIDSTYQSPTNRNIIYDRTVGANTTINSLRIGNSSTISDTNSLVITTNLTVTTDVNLVASNGLVRLALGTGATNTIINGTLTVTNSGSGVSLVTVSNATSLQAGTLSLAGQFTNFGSVNITNAFVQRGGSYSQSGGLLRVGTGGIMVGTNSSFCSMSISNGAVVTNTGQFVVGSAATANSNSVLMTGTGTAIAMTSAAPLVVGSNGSFNAMTVSNSASVTVGGIIQVGALAGASNNTLTVTDSGTLLGGGGEIWVGSSGISNTMSILNGAKVTNSSWVQVGRNAGGRYNTLVVSGADSVLSNAANGILVGNGGLGNMAIITNGASVVTPMIALGWGAAAVSNTVIIGGTGTQVRTIGSGIAVGTNGAFNTMVIASGAVVTNLGRTVVGGSAGATGNFLLVTDSGTYFTNAGQIRVGDSASQNRMVISNGATVLNADIGYIGAVAGANSNSVLVTGAGSLWNIGSNLNVGANAATTNNSLTIASGGAVRVGGGLTLGASAIVTNDAASTFYIAGFFDNQSTNNQANNNLSGRWVFNGGGRTQQVEVASNLRTGFDNTNFYFGTISVGDPITGSNAFVQLVDVRQNAAPAGAEILVASNLNIATAGSTLDLNSRTALVFNLSNTGTIQQVNGGGTLGTINAVNTFTNRGSIFVANGSTLLFSNAFINAASGTILLRDGSVLTNFISGSVLTNYGAIQGVGTLKMTVGNEGTITATGGVLRLSGGFTNTGGAAGGPVNAGLLNSMGGSSELVVNQGFTNLGTINLGAGTVTATRIVNQNLISGYGTVLASLNNFARVTNDSGRLMTFALSVNNYTNGSMIARGSSSFSIGGAFNNAGGLVKVTDQSAATFNAVVTNLVNSTIEARNQSRLTFNAGVTNFGTIAAFNTSTTIFSGTLVLGPSGVIKADASSTIFMRNQFLNYSTNNMAFDTRNATIIVGNPNPATGGDLFLAAGTNKGSTFAGFDNNFAVHYLRVTNTTLITNPLARPQDEAFGTNHVLYVDVLHLEDVNLHIKFTTIYVADRFIVDHVNKEYTAQNVGNGGVIDNGWRDPVDNYRLADLKLTIGRDDARIIFLTIPEPSTFALFGTGMLFLAGRRRRKLPRRADFKTLDMPPPQSAYRGPSS